MASSKVILGPVTFTEREVPDKMPFGGKQAMAIHKNLGGKRNIDRMGSDPHPIKWSGLFFGPNAATRARLLDGLKDTGADLRLSWGTFSYNAVISDFIGEYKHEWEVHYEITVELADVPAITPLSALEKLISDDWGAALATPGLPASVTSAISAAQSAIATVAAGQPNGSLANASLPALQPAIAATEAAYDAVDTLVQQADAAITGVSMDARQGPSIADSFNLFLSEASNAAVGANLRIVRAYIGRIVGNLTTLGG